MAVPREALPDFLGIGAVKAGTTWLHRQLRAHPQLYLPAQKPVFYFDRHRDKPLDRYAGIFRPGAGRVRGEITASYSVLPLETIQQLRELMPDLRLILLLREPRSRDWSEARMELTTVQRRDIKDVGDEELATFLRSQKCRERGDYPAIIERWVSVFPAEQLFIGLYEDVAQHPSELLKQVESFLGVGEASHADSGVAERVFAGPPRNMPATCRELLDERYGAAFAERLHDVLAVHSACWPDLQPSNLARRWGFGEA